MADFKLIQHPKYKKYFCDLRGNIYSIIDGKIKVLRQKNENGYKRVNIYWRGKYRLLMVHRLIYECHHKMIIGKLIFIDHRDRNPSNNDIENLRLCNRAENQYNSSKQHRPEGCSSRYKGVSWDEGNKKWRASIRVDGTLRYLGLFDSEKNAAIQYNRYAVEHAGKFAYLNEVN